MTAGARCSSSWSTTFDCWSMVFQQLEHNLRLLEYGFQQLEHCVSAAGAQPSTSGVSAAGTGAWSFNWHSRSPCPKTSLTPISTVPSCISHPSIFLPLCHPSHPHWPCICFCEYPCVFLYRKGRAGCPTTFSTHFDIYTGLMSLACT